jgi:hypothetical protein
VEHNGKVVSSGMCPLENEAATIVNYKRCIFLPVTRGLGIKVLMDVWFHQSIYADAQKLYKK